MVLNVHELQFQTLHLLLLIEWLGFLNYVLLLSILSPMLFNTYLKHQDYSYILKNYIETFIISNYIFRHIPEQSQYLELIL